MIKLLQLLGRDESGATAVEYGLILALIFLAMIGAVQSFGTTTITTWNNIESAVVAVTGA